jgi:hypothetical protein
MWCGVLCGVAIERRAAVVVRVCHPLLLHAPHIGCESLAVCTAAMWRLCIVALLATTGNSSVEVAHELHFE